MQSSHIAQANRNRRDETTFRTEAAIEEMLDAHERITFYSVAKRAQVARSTLYRREDLKRLVEAARRGERPAGAPEAFERIADLEDELARVKQERDELEKAIAEAHPARYFCVRFESAA